MILDEHNACPACPLIVRDAYATMRRALMVLPPSRPEYEELYLACEALRGFVEAHHANQLHAFAKELESAREPKITEAVTP